MSLLRRCFVFLGPFLAFIIYSVIDLQPGKPAVTAMAAVAVWMALWWISEAVPLAVTALLPVVLFPALGVMSGKVVSGVYFNHIVFLFVGGFLLALAMQKWGLHRRIALRILMIFGKGPARILLGFMLATSFLSMWISNTATVMLMVPVAMAIILSIEDKLDSRSAHCLSTGVLLAIAYSASIGGMATLVGTPPNLSFTRILDISFAGTVDINFAQWMMFALPVCLIMLCSSWLLLYLIYIRRAGPGLFGHAGLTQDYFVQQYQALGKIRYEEKVIALAFLCMALLWVFRVNINLGVVAIPGWSRLFANPQYINDGTVAIAVALVLFLLPSQNKEKNLLEVDVFKQLPWSIVLLFGGGFALATGFVQSGLSAYLAGQLSGMAGLPPLLVIAGICLLITFLTELSSNTATTEIFLPILAAMAVAFEINPLLLMIPATLSASCAFMLPVATPPNAIIFGTNRIHVYQMAKTGVFLNILGVFVISVCAYYWAPVVFDFSLDSLPSWAVLNASDL